MKLYIVVLNFKGTLYKMQYTIQYTILLWEHVLKNIVSFNNPNNVSYLILKAYLCFQMKTKFNYVNFNTKLNMNIVLVSIHKSAQLFYLGM